VPDICTNGPVLNSEKPVMEVGIFFIQRRAVGHSVKLITGEEKCAKMEI
jgi:hypothetical protein